MKNNKVALATLAALGAQIIFGFSFMFTKIALNFSSPITVIANRYMIAFLGMGIVMIVTKTKLKVKSNIWKLIIMSVFQPVLYFLFECYGIQMTTSSFSSVMISMIPVVSMICGIFFLKEIPSAIQYLFTIISIAGVVIMAYTGKTEGTVTPVGILLLLGAVFSSVGYNITSRKISAEFTVFERTFAMTIIGLVCFSGLSIIENIDNPLNVINGFLSSSYTISILYLGLVSSVVAFLFLNFANTHLPVTKTTVFSNITTVVSVVAGALLLNETFVPQTILSTVMIVTGVLGVQVFGMKKQTKNA